MSQTFPVRVLRIAGVSVLSATVMVACLGDELSELEQPVATSPGSGSGSGSARPPVDRSLPAEDLAAVPTTAYQIVGGIDRTRLHGFLAEAATLPNVDVYLTMAPTYDASQPAVLRVNWNHRDAGDAFSLEGIYSEATYLTVTGAVVQVGGTDDPSDPDQGSVYATTRLDAEWLRRFRQGRVEGMCGIVAIAHNVDNRLNKRRFDLSPRDGVWDEPQLRAIWAGTGDPDAPNGVKRGLSRAQVVTGHAALGAAHAGSKRVYAGEHSLTCEQIATRCQDIKTELERGRAGSLFVEGRFQKRPGRFRRWTRFVHVEGALAARYWPGDGTYESCECQISTADALDQDAPPGSFRGVRRTRGGNTLVLRRQDAASTSHFAGSGMFVEVRDASLDYFR